VPCTKPHKKRKEGKAKDYKDLEANIPNIKKAGFWANKNPLTH
jgi:hypothetical protein